MFPDTILTPDHHHNEKKTLSRKFTLGHKAVVSLEVEWEYKKVAIDCGRIEIADVQKNNSFVYNSKLPKTQQFSMLGVELDAGKYRITIVSIQQDRTLRSAIFKTDQGCCG
jgi:hypothetical protein